MAPVKKAAAKKAPAKKAPAKATEETADDRREARHAALVELGKKTIAMRDDEQSWADIAKELGVGQGKAMFANMVANVKPKDRLKADTDEELGALIVEARQGPNGDGEGGQSWGQIAARTGYGEARCRTLYAEASGEDPMGHRIGKGGRFPGDAGTSTKGKAPKKAPATKKAAVKDLNPGKKALADMTEEEISTRLTGKTITVLQGTKRVKIFVKTVKSLDGDTLEFSDKDQKARSISVKAIKAASR